MKRVCDKCNRFAVWVYAPGYSRFYCDSCVPRGCSCQSEDDGTPILGADGREQPCCEYDYTEKGFRVEL